MDLKSHERDKIKKILDNIDPNCISTQVLEICLKNACVYRLDEHIEKFSTRNLDDHFYEKLYSTSLYMDDPPIENIYQIIIDKSSLDPNAVWTDIVIAREDLHSSTLLLMKMNSPRRRTEIGNAY